MPTPYDLSQKANLADFTLKKRGCTGTPPATVAGALGLAEVRRLVSNIYYIRTWAATDGDGVPTLVRATFGDVGGLPAHTAPQALIEGIEHFRVELGLDLKEAKCNTDVDYTKAIQRSSAPQTLVDPSTCALNAANLPRNTLPLVRGDGVPESYAHCGAGGCAVGQLLNVVAAKIFLVARSKDPSPGHQDVKNYTLGSAGAASVPTADQGYKRHLFQTTVRMTNISARRETPLP
jgi:type IV pilus assembly protein PilW